MKEFTRKTKETDINLGLNLLGSGSAKVSTGAGFFDHMLDALARHGLLDLELICHGDTHVDYHHSVEDTGIVLGAALQQEIFALPSFERFACETVILDEAAVEVSLDLSGRPYLHYDIPLDGYIKDFDVELVEEFFRALVTNAKISAHIVLKRGKNKHHIIEAAFKGFGVALRRALAQNPRMTKIPSTKEQL